VLVVDDVVTTGSTLSAAAAALADCGAVATLAAVATTPAPDRAEVLPLRRPAGADAA
jgi:adenine/guanine phosphoribosyltransferase-like PRPP-binding protein